MIEPRRTAEEIAPLREGVLQRTAQLLRAAEKSLSKMAIFRIAELLGKLSVLVAIVFYFAEADERRRSRQAEAWQVIQAASGAGKIPFVEALHEDQGSLAGIDLRGVEGDTLSLVGADLRGARLDGLAIAEANLREAKLMRASLTSGRLKKAEFAGAHLTHADLSGCDLQWANFAGADLSDVDLRGANLFGANFSGANLSRAKVDEETNFSGCIFRGAALCAIDLRPAKLNSADFKDALCLMLIVSPQQAMAIKNGDAINVSPSAGALARAKLCGASEANSAMQLSVPDHQLCYDPARLVQMTIGDFAELTQQPHTPEKLGLTILDVAETSALATTLADAQRLFVAQRQLQNERSLQR